MNSILTAFKIHLNTIQIGIISTTLFDNIFIKYNNNLVKIKTISNIEMKSTNIVHIIPFNLELLPLIENSIKKSLKYMHIIKEKNKIAIKIPLPSKEQRLILTKKINMESEKNKVKIRYIRQINNNKIKKHIKIHNLSLDIEKKYIKMLLDLTKISIEQIDCSTKNKIRTILHV
jgi:ribosome recycling factor